MKTCTDKKSIHKEWREKNKERISQYTKEYYRANREKILAKTNKRREENYERDRHRSKMYARLHKEKLAENFKKWRESNLEYNKARYKARYEKNKLTAASKAKEYRKKNKERIAERSKEYKNNHREKVRHRNSARIFKRRGSWWKHTLQEWMSLIENIKYCPMCMCDKKLTRDHIVPIVMWGTNNIHNIQPLCLSCNSSKNANIKIWYVVWELINIFRQ